MTGSCPAIFLRHNLLVGGEPIASDTTPRQSSVYSEKRLESQNVDSVKLT